MGGDVGVERVWVGGSAVGWSSPGFKRAAAAFCGVGARRAKKGGRNWFLGYL